MQCGICCRGCGCGPCKTVKFDILDNNGNNIGGMTKINPGCVAACLTDADNFSVIFPQDASPEYRALLTTSIIFLDFMFFEDPNENG